MDTTIQKLVHTFGSLADLGQEVASSRGFDDMVRTSLHLLLGTLAIRRGAVVEYDPVTSVLNCRATWGLSEQFCAPRTLDKLDKETLVREMRGISLFDE